MLTISSFTKTVYINMAVWMNYKMSLKIAHHPKLVRNVGDQKALKIRKSMMISPACMNYFEIYTICRLSSNSKL